MSDKNASDILKSWVELYSDKMYSWAFYKIGNKEQAEDIVQDSFMAAFQSFQNFQGKSDPKTWLFGILNNKIADYFRKAYKSPIVAETNQNTESDYLNKYFDGDGSWRKEQRPHEWQLENMHLLDNAEFTKALEGCLGKLPVQWYSAVQLKYISNKNGELICQELQITASNFWQILHRAKLQLRKCLEFHWFKN